MIVALVVVASVLVGVSLMVASGALTYRYNHLVGSSHPDAIGMAVLATFTFPVALPVVLMLWAAVWPQRAEKRDELRRERLAEMEAECGL